MNCKLAMTAAVLALLAAVPATAAILIGTGPGVLQPPENVLFNNNPPNGTTVLGVTNQTATSVSFTGGATLVANGGQARLGALSGAISALNPAAGGLPASQLIIDLTNPALAFTSAEFRLFGGTATTASVSVLDTNGMLFTASFDIPSNGFINAQTTGGQQIDRISFTTNGDVQDVRQVRLGGFAALAALVPEPVTWSLMIMGFGGVGASLRFNRRRQVLA
jgi:hypothetical protein